MIVALIGAHGAGKTTLGRALAHRLGWPFDDEIGARLAGDALLRPPGVTAACPQEAFDEVVLRAELARDALLNRDRHRIVETWHPGNLAYASLRSPAVVKRHFRLIRAALRGQHAVIIEVTASLNTLTQRQWEVGDPSFFVSAGMRAARFARCLDMPIFDEVCSDHHPAEVLADRLVNRIHTVSMERSSS